MADNGSIGYDSMQISQYLLTIQRLTLHNSDIRQYHHFYPNMASPRIDKLPIMVMAIHMDDNDLARFKLSEKIKRAGQLLGMQ